MCFLFLVVFDLCRVFVAREITKNVSDSASLAVAQNLIFFENDNLEEIAKKIAEENKCKLIELRRDYDEIVVVVERELNFILIDKFTSKFSRVQSTSKTKVIYPWDSKFNYCKSYKFSF